MLRATLLLAIVLVLLTGCDHQVYEAKAPPPPLSLVQ